MGFLWWAGLEECKSSRPGIRVLGGLERGVGGPGSLAVSGALIDDAAEHPQVMISGLPAGQCLLQALLEPGIGGIGVVQLVDEAVHVVGDAAGLGDRVAGQADQGLGLLRAQDGEAVLALRWFGGGAVADGLDRWWCCWSWQLVILSVHDADETGGRLAGRKRRQACRSWRRGRQAALAAAAGTTEEARKAVPEVFFSNCTHGIASRPSTRTC